MVRDKKRNNGSVKGRKPKKTVKKKSSKKCVNKKVTLKKRKDSFTQNPVDELIRLKSQNTQSIKKWGYVVVAVLITLCTFSILYLGFNIGSAIHTLETKSEQSPGWYCDVLNEKYGTEICYTPETYNRIRPEGNTYYLHCTWGDYAIKTTQDTVAFREKLFLKMYGCDINMPSVTG